MHDDLYTVAEVAKKIGSNPNYVYLLIKSKVLPALKLGSMKVPKEQLVAFQNKWVGWDLSNPYEPKRLYDEEVAE